MIGKELDKFADEHVYFNQTIPLLETDNKYPSREQVIEMWKFEFISSLTTRVIFISFVENYL
jgi:hypothetical protein